MRFQNTNDVDDYVKAALSFGINCSNPDFIPATDTTNNSNDISTFLRNINQGTNIIIIIIIMLILLSIGLEFPDIRETHAQQFCLSLLINPKFNDLVEDIEELLTKFKERF